MYQEWDSNDLCQRWFNIEFDRSWTKLTILRSGNSLLGSATALGTRCSARLTSRSPMVGSVDAPEPGFRPGARWGPGMRRGFRHALGALACAGGLWRAGGSGACWGFGFPWRLTRLRLCLGWCCGLRVAPGFLFAGLLAVANAMFYFALTWLEYTRCEHMRA